MARRSKRGGFKRKHGRTVDPDGHRSAQRRPVGLDDVSAAAFLQARGLADMPDPISSEIVASSLIARWADSKLEDDQDPVATLGRAMIDFLLRNGTPDALALLYGLSAVERDATILDSTRAIGTIEGSSGGPLPWAGLVGRASFEAAWIASDQFGDQDLLVGRYSYDDAAPHDLAVLIDHNIVHIAKDMNIAPDDAELRDQWVEADGIDVNDVAQQEYVDRTTDALDALALVWDPPITEQAFDLLPLLRSRLAGLPRAKPVKRKLVSQAARDRAYTQFRRSDPGIELDGDTILARDLIDYASDYHGDPLRWSPIVVELCLTDWLPRKVLLSTHEIDRLPIVLRSWARFAGTSKGLAEDLITEIVDAVDEFAPAFKKAMEADDQVGPAKSFAQAMIAAGVDMNDQAAVQSWVEDFNERPYEERERLTGGPDHD